MSGAEHKTRSFVSHPLLILAPPTQTSTLFPLFATTMATGDFRVADISLADFGRREIELAEVEVRGFCLCAA
jgi:hypothetical protein